MLDCKTVLGAAVDKRRVELFLVGIKIEKKLENFILYLDRLGVGSIDLVYEDDRSKAGGQGFFQNKASLSLRTFKRVDHEHHAIYHFHYTLNLPPEIGVTGSIYDVDEVVLPPHRSIFRLDCDASLTLLIHGIHRSIFQYLIFPEGSGMLQHLVDESGLPMIDVCDDGNISDTIRCDGAI